MGSPVETAAWPDTLGLLRFPGDYVSALFRHISGGLPSFLQLSKQLGGVFMPVRSACVCQQVSAQSRG